MLWVAGYVFLFMLTTNLGLGWGVPFYKSLLEWFGLNILGIKDFHIVYGLSNGDSLATYVQACFNSILSLVLAAICTPILRGKRRFIHQFYLFVIVIARYYLALSMLFYGMGKIFDVQFVARGYTVLEEKVGNMSPMGLLWALMSASRSYTFISGLLECVGALLLFWRRTAILGAITTMIVMLNVVLLNYNYAVPVKAFATHLVLLCLFILSPDLKPMWNFFILHKNEKLRFHTYTSDKRWINISLSIIKYIVVIGILYYCINVGYRTEPQRNVTLSDINGVYEIQSIIYNGDTLGHSSPPTASRREIIKNWKRIIIEIPSYAKVYDGKTSKTYTTTRNPMDSIITFTNTELGTSGSFHYSIHKDSAIFSGTVKEDSIILNTLVKHKKDYQLNKSGFHWVLVPNPDR